MQVTSRSPLSDVGRVWFVNRDTGQLDEIALPGVALFVAAEALRVARGERS
jgi:hypothetical protein